MTNSDRPQDDDQAKTISDGWDPIEVLQGRARAATARRDDSIADLRQLLHDEKVLAEFGIDLSRLQG